MLSKANHNVPSYDYERDFFGLCRNIIIFRKVNSSEGPTPSMKVWYAQIREALRLTPSLKGKYSSVFDDDAKKNVGNHASVIRFGVWIKKPDDAVYGKCKANALNYLLIILG